LAPHPVVVMAAACMNWLREALPQALRGLMLRAFVKAPGGVQRCEDTFDRFTIWGVER
jgi:hypothetical protein